MNFQERHSHKEEVDKLETNHGQVFLRSALRRLLVLTITTVLLNLLFQFLLSLLPPLRLITRASIESIAVLIFFIPFGYFFLLRPLSSSVTKRKQTEEAQHNDALSKLTHFAKELAMLSLEDNLEALIAKQFKEIAGAEAATFSDYNFTNRTTTTKHIEIAPGLLETVVRLLGKQVKAFQSVVNDEMYRNMTTEMIRMRMTLYEASFGAVSRSVGAAIQALLKVDRIIGIAYLIEGKLYGTSLLAMRKGQPDPPQEVLKSFAFLAAASLRRTKAEEALRENEAKYRILFDNEIYANCIIDLETQQILDANEAHIRLYGYSRQELMSAFSSLNLSAEKEAYIASIDEISHSSAKHIPIRYHCKKDGTVFPVEIVAIPHIWKGRNVIFAIARDITEQMKAHEAANKAQQLLAISQRLAHIGSWERDLSTGNIFWSDEMYRIAGLPVGSTLDAEIVQSLFPPDEAFRSRNTMAAALQNGAPYSIDYRTKRLDGQFRLVHNEGEVISDKDGKALFLFGTTQDITERKQAEEALKESEERYRNLIDLSSEIIIVVQDDMLKLINRKAVELLGYTEIELKAKPFMEFIYPGDRQIVAANYIKRLKGEALPQRYEFRVPTRDGILIWIELSGKVINWYGKPATLAFLMDITERKHAVEALKESEERFRGITEQSTDGIVVANENGAIVEWNSAQEALTGLKRTEILGLPAWQVEYMSLPKEMRIPESIAQLQAKVKDLLRAKVNPSNERWEHTIVLPDGSTKIVSEHFFVIKQISGNMLVSIINDITTQKNAADDKLLVEKYLQQAHKIESLGVLAGGIAHDFNNILTSIFGFTELAKIYISDEIASDYLSQAMQSIERAKGLTQQLLTFSKGGTPIKRITSLSIFLKETSQFSVSGSNVNCKYDMQGNLWHCNVDKNQIGQLFQNIIINAVQAMPMGGTIQVSAKNVSLQKREHPTLKEGNYVSISIKDQGIGMPNEMLSHIFDPFFTTKIKGHGLGLAISYSIAKRHDGAIDVESELGKGSTFHIYLPACDEAEIEDVEAVLLKHTGTGRILVMDDEDSVRKLISKMLQSFGYSVVCKENGKDAIDFFIEESKNNAPFAAMILDLTVPGGIGGKEVAEEIRKLNNKVPIFVASGYAADPIMANPQEYGFTASISKPFLRVDLIQLLEKHIGK